jgi:PAS domain S-box-containing protein
MMRQAATSKRGEWTKGSLVTGPSAYLLSAMCVGLALLLRLLLDQEWNERLPYVSFFLAVLAVAQFTGIGPSVLAVIAGFLLGDWFFIPPRHSLIITDPISQFNTVFYFVICGVVIFFSRRTRRALAHERASAVAMAKLAAIIESSDDAIIGKTLDGKIESWNAGATNLYGYTEAEAVGQSIALLLPSGREEELTPLLERVRRGERILHFETTRRRKDGSLIEISLSISPVRNSLGEVVGASMIARDITARKKAERERERLLGELHSALRDVKTLNGLLPICSHCKKIRDDKGYWNQIEVYVRKHSDADFTHSICPDCAKDFYPELFKKESPPP